jgi:ribosomal protein L32E
MSRKATSEALTTYWREQIDAWQASGESQQAFCQQHELSYHRFTYWRRKLADQAVERRRMPSALVPVRHEPTSSETTLSLVLPSGIELRGIALDNLAVVRQLLGRLS